MNTLNAINVLTAILANAAQISQAIQNAQNEKRDLTPEEWQTVVGLDNQARATLQGAIEANKA